MSFLLERCDFKELTSDILSENQSFSCGNADLDDFFLNDATRYAQFLMGKSYCFCLNEKPTKIVCALTVSNDSIRIYDLPRSRRDYMRSLTRHEKILKRYPGVLLGRLGVNKDFFGRGIGSEAIDFLKGWFLSRSNKTGCRFLIVDAVNDARVISFYQKNGFIPLFSSEEQELLYTYGSKELELKTRLMYFDLLELSLNV